MKILATLLSAAVLSSFAATVAFGQTNDSGRALVASNALKLSADTERSGITTPVKKFIVPFAGIVRVRWQVKSDGSGGKVDANISSSIDNCTSSTTAATYQQGQCNLRVVAGDLIDVTASSFLGMSGATAFINNVRVFYNVVNNPGTGITLAD